MAGCSRKWRATLEKTRETRPFEMTTDRTSDGHFCGVSGVVLATLMAPVTVVWFPTSLVTSPRHVPVVGSGGLDDEERRHVC